MWPSGSDALATIEILAGAVYVAPLVGEVSVIVGALLVGCCGACGAAAFTVTVIGAERVVAPPLSVATAVSEYVPAGTFAQLVLKGDALSLPMSVLPE